MRLLLSMTIAEQAVVDHQGDVAQFLRFVYDDKVKYPWIVEDGVVDLLGKALATLPEERPSARELLDMLDSLPELKKCRSYNASVGAALCDASFGCVTCHCCSALHAGLLLLEHQPTRRAEHTLLVVCVYS